MQSELPHLRAVILTQPLLQSLNGGWQTICLFTLAGGSFQTKLQYAESTELCTASTRYQKLHYKEIQEGRMSITMK